MVRFCSNCKKILPIFEKNCPFCKNENLFRYCKNCQRIIRPGENACPLCGDIDPTIIDVDSIQPHPTNKNVKKKKSKKPVVISFVTILMIAVLVISVQYLWPIFVKSEDAIRVDELIESIGTVTLNSEEKIVAAEKAASALDREDFEKLDQLQVLRDARSTYDSLVIKATEEAIAAIGPVSLDSGEKIEIARALYNKCPGYKSLKVSNSKILTESEKTFYSLQANHVTGLISEIGTVSLKSKEIIEQARIAYDELDAKAATQVTNLQVLIAAEAKYTELKNTASKQADIDEARSIIRVKRIWCSNPDSAGGVELYFNFTNNSDKIIKYVRFGATFYNAVGDIVTCEIKRDTINYCEDTGPYTKGKGRSGSGVYWGKFYNFTITSVQLVHLEIEYMDGTSITLTDDQLEYVQY